MAKVQFYEDDGDARLFVGNICITISRNDGPIKRTSDVTSVLNKFGYKLNSRWIKCEWGYEASFVRKPATK